MQEKLIKFETAKLAQEKGFNIPCSIVFDLQNNNEVIDFREQEALNFIKDCETGFRTKALNYFKEDYNRKDDNKDFGYFITRPTQSLLQKWLREVHNIHIQIEINSNEEYRVTVFQIIKKFKDTFNRAEFNKNQFSQHKFKSYEEALEVGLLEALKLIKI